MIVILYCHSSTVGKTQLRTITSTAHKAWLPSSAGWDVPCSVGVLINRGNKHYQMSTAISDASSQFRLRSPKPGARGWRLTGQRNTHRQDMVKKEGRQLVGTPEQIRQHIAHSPSKNDSRYLRDSPAQFRTGYGARTHAHVPFTACQCESITSERL